MVAGSNLNEQQQSDVLSGSTPAVTSRVDEHTAALTSDIWQKRLLPFMVCVLAVLTGVFFISTFYQYYQLQKRTDDSSLLEFREGDYQIKTENLTDKESQLELAKWHTLLSMEKGAIRRRYHQANVLLMARIWTKYLGFITGMTLALVGATFILGKLRESEAKLAADSAWWKFSMTTASPGLLLALLGTILMVTTLIAPYEIEVKDGPLYISSGPSVQIPAERKDVDEPEKLENQTDEQIINKATEILRRKQKAKPSPTEP